MAAILIFETDNRDEAHAKLDEVTGWRVDAKTGKRSAIPGHQVEHPRAECREDPSSAKPYQVWSDRHEREDALAEAPAASALDRILGHLETLGARIARLENKE